MLTVEKNRLEAMLLQARALSESGATPSEKAARGQEAIARLEQVIKGNPTFAEAYQTLAEIHLSAWKRPRTKARREIEPPPSPF